MLKPQARQGDLKSKPYDLSSDCEEPTFCRWRRNLDCFASARNDNSLYRHSRESGNPVAFDFDIFKVFKFKMDSRFRGNDGGGVRCSPLIPFRQAEQRS